MSELTACYLLAVLVAAGGGSLPHRILAPWASLAQIAGGDTPEARQRATVARLRGRGLRQIGARDTRCLWAIRTLPAA